MHNLGYNQYIELNTQIVFHKWVDKMEYLIEFILELVFEGGLEATKSNKVPKPIRYIILIIIALFFITIIGLIYLTAFLILKESLIGFILMFLLATFMTISIIIKFRKEYLIKTNNK